MSDDSAIDLTEGELVRLEDFAKQRGISLEQAATLLAQKTITEYWLIKKKPSTVIPFRRK